MKYAIFYWAPEREVEDEEVKYVESIQFAQKLGMRLAVTISDMDDIPTLVKDNNYRDVVTYSPSLVSDDPAKRARFEQICKSAGAQLYYVQRESAEQFASVGDELDELSMEVQAKRAEGLNAVDLVRDIRS